ncbi:two-component response regulator ARR12-like protein [Tanacetum coccineum]|uniref:Two-component response regulator ARR12-like protein n=1 Tax=Tanacetum coccineum TaxID=301880 RepID=A0ABQ5D515_9ASTR
MIPLSFHTLYVLSKRRVLSAYGDTTHVRKGIYHGACDYLVKPVQEKELRLIWQHVIRRKIDKSPHDAAGERLSDQKGKLNKVRKEPPAQKKPRLSWTPPLQAKFLAAVNHLGLENAVPTRILKIMNEENITKAYVASHLQKYRKYLNKISHEASPQGGMVISPYGRSDSAYLQTNCVSLPMFVGFEKVSVGSFPPISLLGESDSTDGMGIFGITSSSIMQESDYQNSVDPMILQGTPNAMDEKTNHPFFSTQNAPASLVLQSSAIQSSLIQSSSYDSNDYSGYRSDNMITRPEKDIIDHGSGSTDRLLGSMIMDMGKRRHIPETGVGYIHNRSNFIGESSSFDPLSVQHYEENVPQMMRPNSSFVGTLEDIACMMNQEKGDTVKDHARRGFLNPSTDTPTAGAQRRIDIAVDLSDEAAFAVKWAVNQYLNPGDAIILINSVDIVGSLVEAGIPYKIHIVKDHDMKERLCLEVERLGLRVVIMGE